jgi:DNA-binding response OmpR family regulator
MICPNTVLLVDADGDCEDLVAKAAARSKLKVRWVRTSREAFQLLSKRIRELALIVVDLDPGAHGNAVLNSLGGCAEAPGAITLTGLEQTYAEPISRGHGAAACLAKPLDIEKLSRTLSEVLVHHFPTCDLWGHTQSKHPTGNSRSALRGIATKLNPRRTRRAE